MPIPMPMEIPEHRSRPQRGAALVVSLVLLLVLTLLGITAMNSSVMQGLMSTSYQSQTTTLSGAEVVLREGELDVEGLLGGAKPTYYYDLVADPDAAPDIASLVWAFDTNELATDGIDSEYVIEYLGRFEVPGETAVLPGGAAGSQVYVFKVTARGEGDRGALRTVQSVYVTLEAP